MVLPGAGYNFGLYGLKAELTLQPGAEVSVPMLLVAVEEAKDGPKAKLADLLASVKELLAEHF
ncbi:hypothetical protein HQ560_11505 [bacterium]|nr:hypothetical protein [bacterium]